VLEPGRDRRTGRGAVDFASASAVLAAGLLPPPDRFEPNDEAGTRAQTLAGARKDFRATLDYYDDQDDVYRVQLDRGRRVVFTLRGPNGSDTNLVLWEPGAKSVTTFPARGLVAALANRPGASKRLAHSARRSGWYYLQVRISSGQGGAYRLVVQKL
jgi:hypothetical protein